MDTYTIVWGPGKRHNIILVHLLNPFGQEIDKVWLPKSWTEQNAERMFRFIKLTLPVGKHVNHEHK